MSAKVDGSRVLGSKTLPRSEQVAEQLQVHRQPLLGWKRPTRRFWTRYPPQTVAGHSSCRRRCCCSLRSGHLYPGSAKAAKPGEPARDRAAAQQEARGRSGQRRKPGRAEASEPAPAPPRPPRARRPGLLPRPLPVGAPGRAGRLQAGRSLQACLHSRRDAAVTTAAIAVAARYRETGRGPASGRVKGQEVTSPVGWAGLQGWPPFPSAFGAGFRCGRGHRLLLR